MPDSERSSDNPGEDWRVHPFYRNGYNAAKKECEAEVERLRREVASLEAELRYASGQSDDDPLSAS